MTEPESKYAGMTVNERLFAAGLLEQWEIAESRQDREKMRQLAVQVDLYMDDSGKLWESPDHER